jgi:hypothetical protein
MARQEVEENYRVYVVVPPRLAFLAHAFLPFFFGAFFARALFIDRLLGAFFALALIPVRLFLVIVPAIFKQQLGAIVVVQNVHHWLAEILERGVPLILFLELGEDGKYFLCGGWPFRAWYFTCCGTKWRIGVRLQADPYLRYFCFQEWLMHQSWLA